MNSDTTPLWSLESPARLAPTLPADTSCDVCVIGAGLAGLATAYLLVREGKSVVVVDAKPTLISGETEHTTAHLAWYIDGGFTRLSSIRGEENARLAAMSHQGAIDLIEEIVQSNQIACDFQRVEGHLVAGKDDEHFISDEMDTFRKLNISFRAEEYHFPNGKVADAIRLPHHARIHPIKYLLRLVELIGQHGGRIFAKTVVEKVRGGETCQVTTAHGQTIAAQSVVIATNNPFEAGTSLHTKVASYSTYALAAEIPRETVSPSLLWDTEDPYHYVRVQQGPEGSPYDYLIVGGEDHKTGQAKDQQQRWERLQKWAADRYPLGAITHHWSGQVFETPDRLALIGETPWNGPNVFIITGDSGMGMTHGTLGARLLVDLIAGRENPLTALYSPGRLMPAALQTYMSENLNLAAQYTDWFTAGDVKSIKDIPWGEGAVIRHGLTKLAVYVDESGNAKRLTATCPHMGGIVHWNPGEKTWDCPCHGSRFMADGTCVHGPATSDLKEIGEKAKEKVSSH